MWTQISALLLLLACCLWPAEAQGETGRRKNIWDDPIQFQTKAKDKCTMIITGQREYTRLRISCQSNKRSYWCEYIGKPAMCRNYNNNPRHYFSQMMWGLRKLQNACQAPRTIKPQMCRRATDESQMVFSSASFSRPWEDPNRPSPPKPADRPSPGPTDPDPVPPSKEPSPKPPVQSNARKLAEQYCWKSLRGVCAFVIGWFKN
ncbi:fibroblast growth factor binding protein 2a [Myripristis murdjan]|uniref:fibroblast growth factor binding protein 2a n=1 Tax=Myripristis murdjan TaxID=586833 RepID=UPI001176456F|nr:fibroblast growth factor-binding protein 2-like [Myripristis murdjan]